MEIEALKKQLEALTKEMPEKLKEIQDRAQSLKPKSSRRVYIIGCDAVVSITDGELITIDFTDKVNAKAYFDSLELK